MVLNLAGDAPGVGQEHNASGEIVVSGGPDLKYNNPYNNVMIKNQKRYGYLALALVMAVSVVGPVLAHAQSLPTPGTSDIAEANAPVWTTLFAIVKYYIATYGSLMLWLFGIIAVFILGVLLAKKFLHF